MSWRDDLAALSRIRGRLAAPERLDAEEVAELVGRADALVASARSALRRSKAAVEHLERTITPEPAAEGGQAGDSITSVVTDIRRYDDT